MCYSALIRQDMKGRGHGMPAARISDEQHRKATSRDAKRFPAVAERIYPNTYGMVFYHKGTELIGEPMRYSAYPPAHISDPKRYTTFNARRDNLKSSFWSEAFGHHHGFVVLSRFYEWVAVKDLLRAKAVTIDEVKVEFNRQAAERKAKIDAAGKKYKATATEAKDPRFRQIIIEFRADEHDDLLVPVIFSSGTTDGYTDHGFAIITDDPPPEISIAGHDRCPVFIEESKLNAWLHPETSTAEELIELLGHRRPLHFLHSLPKAA